MFFIYLTPFVPPLLQRIGGDKEEFRRVTGGIGVSLKQVIDAVNADGGAVTTMREAGTYIENNTTYVRTPPTTGPDSLLELGFFILEF